MKRTTIVQITDLHIPPDNRLIDGVDAKKNITRIFQKLDNEKFDFIVITGDISNKYGETECYDWLKKLLDKSGFKYYLIPGNHDDIENLAKVFDIAHFIKPDGLYYSVETEYYRLILLDSSRNDVSLHQLDWAAGEAEKSGKKPVIFIHHPPAVCNCKFMDQNYPMKNIGLVQEKIKKIDGLSDIFCGHFHTSKDLNAFGRKIHITPSCIAQIDEKSQKLKISTFRIGYRKILLSSKSIKTKVRLF